MQSHKFPLRLYVSPFDNNNQKRENKNQTQAVQMLLHKM
jgi:hypothetical protein